VTDTLHASLTGAAFGLLLTVLCCAIWDSCGPVRDEPEPMFVEVGP
jgi:hypothetical protein